MQQFAQQIYKLQQQLRQEYQSNDNKLEKINELYTLYQSNNNNLILLLEHLQLQPQLQHNKELLNQIQIQLENEMRYYIGSITNVQINLVLGLHPELAIVNKDEIVSLRTNKTVMETQISCLKHENNKYFDTITKKDIDIENLKKENEKLKLQLEELQQKYQNLKSEHDSLKNDHDDLKKEVQKMKDNKAFDRFVIAIQDLNREESLEKKVNPATKTILQELKNDRIGDCHYINDNDSQQKKDDKRNILYDEIKNMSKNIKDMFDNEYPNLLYDIDKFIVNNKTTPSLMFKDKIKRWFYG